MAISLEEYRRIQQEWSGNLYRSIGAPPPPISEDAEPFSNPRMGPTMRISENFIDASHSVSLRVSHEVLMDLRDNVPLRQSIADQIMSTLLNQAERVYRGERDAVRPDSQTERNTLSSEDVTQDSRGRPSSLDPSRQTGDEPPF